MKTIEKEAGVEGLVVKPLSAKLLPITIPEKEGWIDREKLEGISGRSRKRQMELAKQFGIDEYEQPAGGCCYLTDENFARKYKEVISVENTISRDELYLLTIGRHFRLPTGTKVIVTRNEGEGNFIKGIRKNYWYAEPIGKGAVAIARPISGEYITKEDKKMIADLIARYSKTDERGEIKVKISPPKRLENQLEEDIILGHKLEEAILEDWRI